MKIIAAVLFALIASGIVGAVAAEKLQHVVCFKFKESATPQEIQQATQFAECMRQHGWPNFPDPDSHGHFEVTNPNDGPTTKSDPSFQACRARLATAAP